MLCGLHIFSIASLVSNLSSYPPIYVSTPHTPTYFPLLPPTSPTKANHPKSKEEAKKKKLTLIRLLLIILHRTDQMGRLVRHLTLPNTAMSSDPTRHLVVLPAVTEVARTGEGHTLEDLLAGLLGLGFALPDGVGCNLAGNGFGSSFSGRLTRRHDCWEE